MLKYEWVDGWLQDEIYPHVSRQTAETISNYIAYLKKQVISNPPTYDQMKSERDAAITRAEAAEAESHALNLACAEANERAEAKQQRTNDDVVVWKQDAAAWKEIAINSQSRLDAIRRIVTEEGYDA